MGRSAEPAGASSKFRVPVMVVAASLRRGRTTALSSLTRFLNSPCHGLSSFSSTGSILNKEVVRSSSEKTPTRTAAVLHGLLGSGRNWRSFSRNLAATLSNSFPPSEWEMTLLDLRNHGKSVELGGFRPPHDISSAAADVVATVGCPDVVIGHSLGGKVALQVVLRLARGDFGESEFLPKQVWVLDSPPGKVPERSDDVDKVLKTLRGLPSSIPSRSWLVDHMIQLGFSKSLSHWIGSNLNASEEHLTWAFNLEGAVEMFNSYRNTSYWSLLEHPPKGLEIEMVVAENSERWDPDDIQQLERLASHEGDGSEGKVSLHFLPNAGHWVHVDNPKGLLEIMAPKMAAL